MEARIIKFRAWDKRKKKFIDEFNITENGDVFRINYFETCESLDVIIGQFTGLKDTKGKEIFEGDIVKYISPEYLYSNDKHEFKTRIVFREGAFTVDLLSTDLKTNGDYIYWREAIGFSGAMSLNSVGTGVIFEVIGNIHENPELLK